MIRRALTSVLLLAIPLLLQGCAAGVGNYGPRAPLIQRRGDRIVGRTSETLNNGNIRVTTYHRMENSSWAGALTFGLGVGRDDVTLTGMRDSTVTSKYLHSDLVVNLGDSPFGIGGTLGYLTTEFPGEPAKFTYSGITVGPMLFVGLSSWLNLDASAAKVFGSIKDDEGYYFTPAYGFPDSKLPLPGWRYQADINLIPIRTDTFDGGVRIGYQSTTTDEKDVYGAMRKYTSKGPVFELLALWF